MAAKLYTENELLRKFKNKFIDTYPHRERDEMGNWITLFEVRSVKKTIHENHNLPEEEIRFYKN